MSLQHQRVLEGRGAADAGAVLLRRPHALDHHHRIGQVLPLPQPPLKFLLGDDAGVGAVAVIGPPILHPADGHNRHAVADLQLPGRPPQSGDVLADKPARLQDLGVQMNGDQRLRHHPPDQRAGIRLWVQPHPLPIPRRLLERMVHVEQVASQPVRPFHQMDRKTLTGQGEGRVQPGRAPTDDQRGLLHRHARPVERLQPGRLRHRHPHQVLRLLGRPLPIVLVNPRALVADVGHLKEVRVEPRLPDGLLEERLVGERCTGRNDDPVQVQFPHPLNDAPDGILGAGVEVVLRVDNPRQGGRVLCHRRDIQIPGNVGTAFADEHPNAQVFSGNVPLRRIDLRRRLGPAGRGQQCPGQPGRGAGLHHRFGDVLRLPEGPDGKDPRLAGLQRREGDGLAEAVGVRRHADPPGQVADTLRDLHPHREHHQVKLLLPDAPPVPLVYIPDDQVAALRVLLYRRDAAADKTDAVSLFGPAVEIQIPLAEGPHVHQEDGHLGVRLVLYRHHRLFDGVDAADGRAIVVFLVAGADALDEGDALRRPSIGRALDVPQRGAGRVEEPLKLQGCDHVGVAAPAVLSGPLRVKRGETRGQQDGADLQFYRLLHHVVVDGSGLASVDATQTLGTHTAIQTSLRLCDRLSFGEAQVKFHKALPAFLDR